MGRNRPCPAHFTLKTHFLLSHRPSLLKHHVRQLIITGKETVAPQPEYTLLSLSQPATEHEAQTLDAEIEQLRKTLEEDAPEWEKRLAEVKADLNGTETV